MATGPYLNGFWVQVARHPAAPGATTSVAVGRAWAENRWTHLLGVYDVQGRQLRLYVNGELAGSATRAGVWTATGPLTIGHARFGTDLPSYVSSLAAAASGIQRDLITANGSS